MACRPPWRSIIDKERDRGRIRPPVPGLCLLAALAPLFARAQAVSGTILGTVRDASGAVIPDARVTLTHAGTGLARAVTTDSTAMFAAPLLATGSYTVAAEAPGFRKESVAGVLVTVDQKVRVELKLDLGDRTDSVDVQADNPLVQTASSDLSTTVEATQIQGLPLNGRNFREPDPLQFRCVAGRPRIQYRRSGRSGLA
jgi:hypothetical protein